MAEWCSATHAPMHSSPSTIINLVAMVTCVRDVRGCARAGIGLRHNLEGRWTPKNDALRLQQRVERWKWNTVHTLYCNRCDKLCGGRAS